MLFGLDQHSALYCRILISLQFFKKNSNEGTHNLFIEFIMVFLLLNSLVASDKYSVCVSFGSATK